MADSLKSVLAEFIARWSAGEAVPVGEYVARFPAHGEELRRCIEDFLLVARAVSVDNTICEPGPEEEPVELLGRCLGGFHILREIGRGAMGVVYEAQSKNSSATVAIKILRPDRMQTHEARERFRREARIMASLDHENCVFIHGLHDLGGVLALSMEQMSGETLQDRVNEAGEIEVEQAVRWTLDILAGLAAVHERGVLHRDLKPANCFVTADGRIKLGDFGLARTTEDDPRLTREGCFLGTPVFAPPEQIRGDPLDERSDLYAVGATLYVMLASRYPFRGRSAEEFMARALTDAPEPLTSVRPDVPRSLSRIVLRCLEKSAERRPGSAGLLARMLEPFAGRALVPAPIGRRITAWLVDLVLLNLLAGTFSRLACVRVEAPISYQAGAARSPGAAWPLGEPVTPEQLALMLLYISLVAGYFGVAEARLGRTAGKWLLGIRVARAEGTRSAWTLGLGRALFTACLLGAGHVSYYLYGQFGGESPGIAVLCVLDGYFAIPLLSALGMSRRNGQAMLHDRLTGTRVVLDRRPARTGSAESAVRDAALEEVGGGETVGERFVIDGRLGGAILATDRELNRPVLLLPASREAIRSFTMADPLERPMQLRMIRTEAPNLEEHLVLERPGGEPFQCFLDRSARLDWKAMHLAVLDLLGEVALQRTVPEIESLWMDRRARLRMLPAAGRDDQVEFDAGRLQWILRRLLLGAEGTRLRRPVQAPLSAEPLLSAILEQPLELHRLEDLRRAWAGLDLVTGRITREWRVRAALLGIVGIGALGWLSAQSVQGGTGRTERLMIIVWFASASMVVCAVVSVILGFALGNSPLFRLTGMGLRCRDGLPAGRLRHGIRVLAFWVLVLGLLAPSVLWRPGTEVPLLFWLSLGALMAFAITEYVRSVLHGHRSLLDLIAGTYVVPL